MVFVILALVSSYSCFLRASLAAETGRERVRIALSARSLAYLDVLAGHERGVYRKHGLESEIIIMPPALSMVALQAGEIDYSFMAGTVVRVALKGLSVKLAGLSIKSSFHTLVARASIESIAGLQGKTIAISNVGSSDQVVAEYLLRKRGLDPRRDVVFISMGGSDTRYQALLTGKIDATALSLPHFIMAKTRGFNALGSAMDVLEMAVVGIGTTTRKIQQEREQVKKMVRSHLDTMRWIKNSKREVLEFVTHFLKVDERTAVESYDIYSRLMVDDMRVLPQAVNTAIEMEGFRGVSLDKVADPTIVEEVLNEGK
jgi:ABC-type nitrate/sulfonate/bicarbonate transport system substrate-binding protein